MVSSYLNRPIRTLDQVLLARGLATARHGGAAPAKPKPESAEGCRRDPEAARSGPDRKDTSAARRAA